MQKKLFRCEKNIKPSFPIIHQIICPLHFLKDNIFKQLNFILSWDFGEIHFFSG